jgi:ABC-type dipeptide/oligopeptide/nickel transport system permease subunit
LGYRRIFRHRGRHRAGASGGYIGGWTDIIIMRFMDVLLAFPGLLQPAAIVTVLGPG